MVGFLEGRSIPGNGEGGSGVEEDGLAGGGFVFAGEDRGDDFGVSCGVPAEEVFPGGGGDTKICGVDFKGSHDSFFPCGDLRLAEGGNLVEAESIGTCAVGGPRAFTTECFERAGVSLDEGWVEHSRQLIVWACGVQERPDHVENAGGALVCEEFPDGGDGFEGGVPRGGEEEATSALLKRGSGLVGGEGDIDSKCLEDIRAAGF